ncbi:Multiubiquitin [Paenibacillus sp. yr247]|uniref:E2/UBC family protein n=1 Tax=Paenibacillus sp. yr247 TaxID=1761880 RepID=UPI00088311D6|nr:E2/UBC family protein [Paenibacillus sp. yr247]SDP02442.1 Multiubiquitin [Paenibacillus sp. yr247]
MESNHNLSKYPIEITIGTTEYKVPLQSMTANEIKKLAGANVEEYDLYLEVDGPEETELIPDEQRVILVDEMQFFIKHRVNPDVSITIDTVNYTAPKHAMTGRELKQLANIPPEFALYLIQSARSDIQIPDDQIVYLITDEQFISMKSNINNGNTLVDAAAVLPQREISYLKANGFQYELRRNPENPSELFLTIDNFDMGENYSPRHVTMLVKIPAGFPSAAMDMFWVKPAVTKSDGHLPASVCDEQYIGSTWQRFSRHRDQGTWNPITGGLRAHFTFVSEALRKGE